MISNVEVNYEIYLRSRFSWFDNILMLSVYLLVPIIGWWAVPVVLVGAVVGALISVSLGVA
jgi:hypothetical protein